MALYDRDNPQHLAYLKRHMRAARPGCALPADSFCQRCEMPYDWCDCPVAPVAVPVAPTDERLLALVVRPGPLTDEEQAYLDVRERAA